MKKALTVCMAAMMALTLLTGCKGKDDTYEPVKSGIYVREDGSVVSADVEEFAESYYDKTELTGFVEDEIVAYNKKASGMAYAYAEEAKEVDKEAVLPVALKGLTVEGQKAVLLLEFATGKDYLDFNGDMNVVLTALAQTTVKEAKEAGKTMSGLKDAEGAAADEAKVAKKKNYEYLTLTVAEGLTEAMPVQVQGTIQYVSGNVTITGENTVAVPAGETAVIIYK